MSASVFIVSGTHETICMWNVMRYVLKSDQKSKVMIQDDQKPALDKSDIALDLWTSLSVVR